MFERRLRTFLFLLFLGGLILAARAAQVQVLQAGDWAKLETTSAERIAYLTPERGDILDRKGRVLATDVPAFEACVNYRAIPDPPDAAWLGDEAKRRARLLPTWKGASEEAHKAMVEQERQGTLADLERMWDLLARVSGQTREQIDERRRDIVDEVENKHESYWRALYDKADDEFKATPPAPWYERWVVGKRTPPDPKAFESKTVGEQLAFHPVVGDVSQAVFNELKFAQDEVPQVKAEGVWRSVLDLRPAVRRKYPYGDVACHVIGRVDAVNRMDREADPNKNDPLRRYALIDRIGREGLEKLAEQQLRGDRGARRTDRRGEHLRTDESTPGSDVHTTIDVALQEQIQDAFRSVDFIGPFNPQDKEHHKDPEHFPMNGAAVVLDVKTGEVLALVSVPTYDLNRFGTILPKLLADDLNDPMRNRALRDAMEPGSTAKPIVGLGAVTQGLTKVTDTVECNGQAVLPDHTKVAKPRCWTMSMYGDTPSAYIHHHIPSSAPHPTGFLNLTDAIERSCNVYFLSQGDKLGVDGLSYWMRQFGFGRTTGIGLPETAGLVPDQAHLPAGERRSAAWFAAIGQGKVNATPIQVANEMATIARDGIWMRPRLVPGGSPVRLPTTRPDGSAIDDVRDLHLDPEALRAVHTGMFRVVNSDAGTGTKVRDDALGVQLACKTGSATAAQKSRPMRNANGELMYWDNGRPRSEFIPYGWKDALNPQIPWYRASGTSEILNAKGEKVGESAKGTHSWVGGYAPADKPQVAFAVYVEYGNSGGIAAGSVVKKLIAACVKEGYVTAKTIPAEPTPAGAPKPPSLLARPTDEPMQTEEPNGPPVDDEN